MLKNSVEIKFIMRTGMRRNEVIQEWFEVFLASFVNHAIDFKDGLTINQEVLTLCLSKKKYVNRREKI